LGLKPARCFEFFRCGCEITPASQEGRMKRFQRGRCRGKAHGRFDGLLGPVEISLFESIMKCPLEHLDIGQAGKRVLRRRVWPHVVCVIQRLRSAGKGPISRRKKLIGSRPGIYASKPLPFRKWQALSSVTLLGSYLVWIRAPATSSAKPGIPKKIPMLSGFL
jgi:hypothetical protein